MARRVQAIVFDFDGLLADSEPVQIQAWQQFLARYRRTLEPELLHELFGLRTRDSAELVQHSLELPITADQVMAERDEIFMSLVERDLILFPDASALIEDLASMPGVRLALATSGRREYIDVALRVAGIEDAFEQQVTGDDVRRGKPDPEIYLSAASRLGVSPSVCVALEDAPHGIRSAKDAGMTCLAVPNDMTRNLSGFEIADAVLGRLSEVVPWLVSRGMLLPDDG